MPFTKVRSIAVGHHGVQDGNETNFATVDASGTAIFTKGTFSQVLQTSAAISAGGSVYVDGSVRSIGPVKSGAAGQFGTAILVQRATLAANTTAASAAEIVLPSGSNIIDIYVDVEVPFQTAAGVTAAEVQVSAAGGVLLARINVSASTTRYGTMKNAQAVGSVGFRNVTATIEAHASIQGSNTAMSDGQAMLTIVYVN